MKRIFALFAAAMILTGCGAPSIYSWGRYEGLIYTMYSEPGKAGPEYQIAELEADLEKARARNKAVPPGFHAHLGYLYAQTGNISQAKQSLEAEKTLFPESTVFVDRLIANLERK